MANIVKKTGESRWNRIKDTLKDGLNAKQARQLDSLMENTRKHYIAEAQKARSLLFENARASAVSTGNIATLNKVVLPIMRRVLPNVIANEIIGVQPMPGPIAQVMTLRYLYGRTRTGAGVMAGDEAMTPLHIHDLAVSYSGNENRTNPAAAFTAQLEGVPGNAMKLEVLKQVVEAKSRRLRARWTIERQTDALNMYRIDVEEELLMAVAQEITVEIDQEILRSLRTLVAPATTANTFDQSAVRGQPISVADEFAALVIMMNRQRNLIATKTRRGPGNWAVVSPAVVTILERARASAFVRTTEGQFDAPTNNKFVGTLNNAVKVYADTYADDRAPVLIGYKGQTEVDAATFYCPYIPLTTHGIVTDPNRFEMVTRFYTRYGYVEFTSTATSLGNRADYLGQVAINGDTLTFY